MLLLEKPSIFCYNIKDFTTKDRRDLLRKYAKLVLFGFKKRTSVYCLSFFLLLIPQFFGATSDNVYVSLPVRIVQYLRDFELTAELVEKKQHLFALVIGYTAELVIRRAIGGEF